MFSLQYCDMHKGAMGSARTSNNRQVSQAPPQNQNIASVKEAPNILIYNRKQFQHSETRLQLPEKTALFVGGFGGGFEDAFEICWGGWGRCGCVWGVCWGGCNNVFKMYNAYQTPIKSFENI